MPILEQTEEQRRAAYRDAGVPLPASIPKVGEPIPGTNLRYEQEDITNLQTGPQEPTVIGSSSQIRQDLAKRGVTDQDAFKFPSQKTFEEFKRSTEPGITKPAAPQFKDAYAQIRSQQGISALEDDDVGLETEKGEVEAAFREFQAKQRGEAIPMGIITGRISEEERNFRERIDFIERRQRVIQMKIKNKQSFISDYMGFSEKDYDEARDEYEFEFNKAIQVQTAYQNYKNAEEQSENRVRDDARATLNTMNNLIANSGVDFDQFISGDPAFSSRLSELEAMAGMPIGSFETFPRSKPKANLLSTTVQDTADGGKAAYFVYSGADGVPSVVAVGLPGAVSEEEGGGGETEFTQTQLQQGAEAAGKTVAEFKALPGERQRFYIFGTGKDLHGGRMASTQ